jgi:hypothetical protein
MMQIIRDEELGGIMMIPLLIEWGVRRCNVKDCTEQPTTIITGMHPKAPLVGMCEEHFQAANKPDHSKVAYTFVFDDFDAFKPKEVGVIEQTLFPDIY